MPPSPFLKYRCTAVAALRDDEPSVQTALYRHPKEFA